MHELLLSSMPSARLQPYADEAALQSADVGALYRWNADVSRALFDDIGVLEVAMRSAMARELGARFGHEWFRDPTLFDDDTVRLISTAWIQGRLATLHANGPTLAGKLVASLMFGFWVKILGKGSHRGLKDPIAREPIVTRRVYDDLLWKPALSSAFPHVGRLERSKVERAARDVQFIRNRVAHHEHVIWGVPAYGQKNPNGSVRRISVTQAFDTIHTLAGYIDVDLAAWLQSESRVGASVARCPLADTSRFRL